MSGCTTCGHDETEHVGLLIRPCWVRRCQCVKFRPVVSRRVAAIDAAEAEAEQS